MSLAASLNKFKSEISEATSRNIQHARPGTSVPSRTSTPKPGDSKRKHDTAFSAPQAPAPATAAPATAHAGSEIMTQVVNAVKYLKEKDSRPIAFDDLIGYLSLPVDLQRNIPYIRRILVSHDRVDHVPKSESPNGKDSFRYRPIHPVTSGDELTDYLARLPTAQGIQVKELKDGWPDCTVVVDRLEREGALLVTRHKKDNTPRMVWTDSPTYHILSQSTQLPQKVDSDFVDFWAKTKLPASDIELRAELEKAGLTPTSQVKEIIRGDLKKKEKRKVNRKGGKTTNSHMLGILKDYGRK